MADIWLQLRHIPEPVERVNVVHFNDMHENINNIDSFITARDEFYHSHPNDKNITLAAGDIFNRFPQNERIVANFVKDYLDASAPGNRDLEKGARFSKTIKKYGIEDRFVGSNLVYQNNPPLQSQLNNVKIINGIGIIGLSPVDYAPRLKRSDNKDVSTKNFDETIRTVEEDVKKLESQGVNKIFVLAHTGEFSGHNPDDAHDIDYYKKLSEISGVDVIIGGHDHRQADRWEVTKRGEPVKIVSTGFGEGNNSFGANLDSFGVMSLVFDKNGVLKPERCENKFLKTELFVKTPYTEQFPQHWINWGKLTDKTITKFYNMKRAIKSWFNGD